MAAKTKAAPGTAAQREDAPWDARILELVDAGIDGTLIEENLRRTPTERLARMQAMLSFLEQAKRGPESDRAQAVLDPAEIAAIPRRGER